MTTEAQFYRRLRDNLERCEFTRLESRATLGLPDLLIAFEEGFFITLELKVVRSGMKVALSAHQVSFHARHATLGCPAGILVACLHLDEIRLYSAEQAVELQLQGLRLEPVGCWPLRRAPWHVIRDELTALA
jgi:hypothetical protein